MSATGKRKSNVKKEGKAIFFARELMPQNEGMQKL